jgi:signal transduction histidine kinase
LTRSIGSSNASHELRTPLAMMRTTLDVEVAKPGGVPAQTRELDAELSVDLDHADRLLDSFLTLARTQHGQLGEHNQGGARAELAERAHTVDIEGQAAHSLRWLGELVDGLHP